MRNHADDEARGWSIGDDDVRVLEMVPVVLCRSQDGLAREGVDGVRGADEAGERRRIQGLVDGPGAAYFEYVKSAAPSVREGILDVALQLVDHAGRAVVARSDDIAAMEVGATAKALLDGFYHLGRVPTGAEDVEGVAGRQGAGVGSRGIGVLLGEVAPLVGEAAPPDGDVAGLVLSGYLDADFCPRNGMGGPYK